MGYVRTSLRAWEHRANSDDQVLNAELDFMTHFPFREHVPVLLDRAEVYPATDEFLRDRKESFALLIRDHQGRPSEFAPAYAKHVKEGSPLREAFASDFDEVARRFVDRYPVDELAVAA